MIKIHNVLLACALGAGSLLGAAAPASAAHVSVVTARPAATGRVLPGSRYYGTAYRAYPYRYGYGNPYRHGTAIPTATALVLATLAEALATATLAEATVTALAEATAMRPIRRYMGLAHIGHVIPIGALIAAHIRDSASSDVSLPSFEQGSNRSRLEPLRHHLSLVSYLRRAQAMRRLTAMLQSQHRKQSRCSGPRVAYSTAFFHSGRLLIHLPTQLLHSLNCEVSWEAPAGIMQCISGIANLAVPQLQ